MNTIREQSKNPIVVGIVGFVVGVLFGLIVLGWWLWPVKWTDASPAELSAEWQNQYLRMAINQFGVDGNLAQAEARFEALGKKAPDVLADIKQNPGELRSELIAAFDSAITTGVSVVPPAPAVPSPGAATTPVAGAETPAAGAPTEVGGAATQPAAGALATPATEAPEKEGGNRVVSILITLICIVLLAIAAGIAFVVLRGRYPRTAAGSGLTPYQEAEEARRQVGMTDYSAESEPPVAQWQASYVIGDDLFDVSESIDSPSGEFLGECGVGISDTIGEGDRKKVTAFEVWLFDKNDIQTVTKVLMSTHAFFDGAIRARLEAKGEPIQAESGAEFVLETQTLQMVATVKDMAYGDNAMPPQSYFDRMIVELAIWQK